MVPPAPLTRPQRAEIAVKMNYPAAKIAEVSAVKRLKRFANSVLVKRPPQTRGGSGSPASWAKWVKRPARQCQRPYLKTTQPPQRKFTITTTIFRRVGEMARQAAFARGDG